MTRDALLRKLTLEYYSTRPNLTVPSKPLAILFLACSGSGKSTVRRRLVETLHFTYVCNDEVRELLEKYPEAAKLGIELKDVVSATWNKILTESVNKAVVFDNNIIMYYMHDDSYLNVAIRNRIPLFIINIEQSIEKLQARVKARGVNVDQILRILPDQAKAYEKAVQEVKPDARLIGDASNDDMDRLIKQIKSR